MAKKRKRGITVLLRGLLNFFKKEGEKIIGKEPTIPTHGKIKPPRKKRSKKGLTKGQQRLLREIKKPQQSKLFSTNLYKFFEKKRDLKEQIYLYELEQFPNKPKRIFTSLGYKRIFYIGVKEKYLSIMFYDETKVDIGIFLLEIYREVLEYLINEYILKIVPMNTGNLRKLLTGSIAGFYNFYKNDFPYLVDMRIMDSFTYKIIEKNNKYYARDLIKRLGQMNVIKRPHVRHPPIYKNAYTPKNLDPYAKPKFMNEIIRAGRFKARALFLRYLPRLKKWFEHKNIFMNERTIKGLFEVKFK